MTNTNYHIVEYLLLIIVIMIIIITYSYCDKYHGNGGKPMKDLSIIISARNGRII